jgi:FkbM family methyltransferase
MSSMRRSMTGQPRCHLLIISPGDTSQRAKRRRAGKGRQRLGIQVYVWLTLCGYGAAPITDWEHLPDGAERTLQRSIPPVAHVPLSTSSQAKLSMPRRDAWSLFWNYGGLRWSNTAISFTRATAVQMLNHLTGAPAPVAAAVDVKTKTAKIGSRNLVFRGAAPDDHYFGFVGDGMEDPFHNLIAALNLSREGIALDIGANIGVTAAIMSEHFHWVYAFEPGPSVHAALSANMTRNGLRNVSPVHAAMSDRIGTLRFAENSAYGHIAEAGIEADAWTIDGFVASQGLRRVDFIKIDVEGFEKQVLRGGAETIARFNPVIHMEFNSWCQLAHADTNPIGFAAWVVETFPFVYLIGKAHPPTIDRITKETAGYFVHANMSRGFVDDLLIANRPISLGA